MLDNYIFLALFISFLWGIQVVIHKHLLTNFYFVTIMLVSNVINVSLIIALSIYLKNDVFTDLKKITFRDAVILVCLPIFTVFIANIIYYYILKKHESSLVSAITYSSPAFTLILAYLFLNERLDIYGLSGIFAIIAGVVLISNNNSSYKILQLFTDSH